MTHWMTLTHAKGVIIPMDGLFGLGSGAACATFMEKTYGNMIVMIRMGVMQKSSKRRLTH